MNYYDVMVTVNLPDHEEVAYQVKNVTLDEAMERAYVQYPTWTSAVITALRAGTLIGEPS